MVPGAGALVGPSDSERVDAGPQPVLANLLLRCVTGSDELPPLTRLGRPALPERFAAESQPDGRRFGSGMMVAMKKLHFPVPVVTTDYLPGGGEIVNAWVVWAVNEDAGTALSALSRYAAEVGASAVIATRVTTTAAAGMGASMQVAYGTAVTVAAA